MISEKPTLRQQKMEILEINSGNPLMSFGAFGEVSIALAIHKEDSCGGGGIRYEDSCGGGGSVVSIQHVAVKKITNSLVPKWTQKYHWKNEFSTIELETNIRRDDQTGLEDHNHGSHRNKPSFRLCKAAFCELAALRALSQSHHPCITPLISASQTASDESSMSLIFPFCPIDLATLIRCRKTSLDLSKKTLRDHTVRVIMRDILSAVSFCHSKGILHRDIKPGNFVVAQEGRIQLIDFGLAKVSSDSAPSPGSHVPFKNHYDSEKIDSYDNRYELKIDRNGSTSHALCTLYYRPPEILFGSTDYGYEVDVWGCGLVFAELLNLSPLFQGRNVLDQIGRIFDVLGTPHCNNWPNAAKLEDFGKMHFQPKIGLGICRVVPRLQENILLKGLIEAMLSLDPTRRLTANQCIQHHWFVDVQAGTTSSPMEIINDLIPVKLRSPNYSFNMATSDQLLIFDAILNTYEMKAEGIASARRETSSTAVVESVPESPKYTLKVLEKLRRTRVT